MPTGSLEGEGKALWERIYNKALKGSCKGDKECAARTAWAAIKNAGWSKDGEGKWHKKTVLSEFSLYISRASFDKATQRMNWFAVASDTSEDHFKDNMTESLFDDFEKRIETKELPPPKFRSEFWNGGNPYVSLSHYPDLEGKAVPGITDRVYKDGNRLKASGHFLDTPLGRACFRAICKDLYPKEKSDSEVEPPVRISIAFLDYSHKHKSNGYLFVRSEEEPVCMECVREHFEKSGEGLEFLKGHLIHLALTRVPANERTLIEPMEVDKMAINTRKDDALSIVGDEDEEVLNLVDEISEEASMVGKSELVIKSDEEDAPELVEEMEHGKDKKKKMDDEEEDAMDKKKKETKKSVAEATKAVVDAPNAGLAEVLSAIAELKSEITEIKSAPAPVVAEVEAHPLDAYISNFKSAYDEAIKVQGTADDKLATLQEPFNAFSQAIVEQVRSTIPSEPVVEAKSGASVEEVTQAVMQQIGPTLEEIKSMISRNAVPQGEQPQGVSVRDLVHRRSLLPQNTVPQQTLQKPNNGLKSVRDVVERTT